MSSSQPNLVLRLLSFALRVLKDWRFTTAAALLCAGVIGWSALLSVIIIEHSAVPWPSSVQVDKEGRLVQGLRTRLGSFESPETIPVANGGSMKGEVVLDEEVRTQLLNEAPSSDRLKARTNNWYVSRIYRRIPDGAYWQLDVTYYTGPVERVVHVPGVCMQVAGATPTGEETVEFRNVGGDSSNVSFRKAQFEMPDKDGKVQKYTQYYTFVLNGRSQSNEWAVRTESRNPRGSKFFYFAKIQFAPRSNGTTDQSAEEFVRDFLPAVLKTLPTARDVAVLNEAYKRGK